MGHWAIAAVAGYQALGDDPAVGALSSAPIEGLIGSGPALSGTVVSGLIESAAAAADGTGSAVDAAVAFAPTVSDRAVSAFAGPSLSAPNGSFAAAAAVGIAAVRRP